MRKLATCTFLNNASDNLQSLDSPLQMKLINYLGLKKYMIDNFVFKRKPSKYAIRKKDGINHLYTDSQFVPPEGYRARTTILETSSHSVPVLRLTPKQKINHTTIVYAHGNASDMADSLTFIELLSQLIQAEFVIFDYSGYGESRVLDVGQEVICKDLEIVLAWLSQNRSIEDIILWGFSLGTFPVLSVAQRYPVKGVILQCPIASISCIFHEQLHPDMKFKEDHFANIDFIENIRSKILILHSSQDQIIPISHAKLLFQKFVRRNGEGNIDFIEVSKIRHNSLHRYIVSPQQNALQKEVFSFLLDLIYASGPQALRKRKKSAASEKTDSGKNIETKGQKYRQSDLEMYSEKDLLELRMKITEAVIEQLPQDMDEIVVDEITEKVTVKNVGKNISKDCFCFPNIGSQKNI